MVGHAAVVLQRFGAVGLLVEAGHRNVADFQQLRRGEEGHVGGVVVDGIHHAALFDQDGLDAAVLQFDAAGQAGGAGADHESVERCRHSVTACSRLRGRRFRARQASAAASLPPPSAMSGRPPPLPPTACASAPTSLPACTFAGEVLGHGGDDGDGAVFGRGQHHHGALPLVAQRIGQRAHLLRGPCRRARAASTRDSVHGAGLRFQVAGGGLRQLVLELLDLAFRGRARWPAVFSTCSTSSGSEARNIPAMRRRAPVDS